MSTKQTFALAKKLRTYLECNKDVLAIPFINRFPFSSCEVSSLILCIIFSNSSLVEDLYVVEAYDRDEDETHFYLKVNTEIIDITADQFKGVDLPLYGSESSVINDRFSEQVSIRSTDFLVNSSIFTEHYKEFSKIANEIVKI
jgi:hypothetical protein